MKKVISCIAIVLVLLACCLPLLLFVGFGYLESGGSCIYKGPLASADGACSNNPSNDNNTSTTTKTYTSSTYKFSYPSDWTEDSTRQGVVSVYPNTGPQGQSMSVTSQEQSDPIELNQSYCSTYSSNLISSLENSGYSSIDVISSAYQTLNSYPACWVEFSGVVSGLTVFQKQYLIIDPSVNNDEFYLTVTVFDEDSLSMFDSVINTFEIL
jgi:hypothetical protein